MRDVIVAPRRRHDVRHFYRLYSDRCFTDFNFFEMSFLGYNYAQHQNAQQSVRMTGCRIATVFLTFFLLLGKSRELATDYYSSCKSGGGNWGKPLAFFSFRNK